MNLYQGKREQSIQEIRSAYQAHGFALVHFLYFATGAKTWLRWHNYTPYKRAMDIADYVLPDGIALQIVEWCRTGRRLSNLNGTDRTPAFLDFLRGERVKIFLYGATQESLTGVQAYIQKKWITVQDVQDGYHEYDFSHLQKTWGQKVLLVALWSPKQETRVWEHKDLLKTTKTLVITVWGLFDFLSGRQKRAPQIVRTLKGEWLWRLCEDPQRNIRKVLRSLAFVPCALWFLWHRIVYFFSKSYSTKRAKKVW